MAAHAEDPHIRGLCARLIGLLVAAREKAGIRQRALAEALDVPQSFIAKYDGGERRIDVIEFVAIARALGADPLKLLRDFLAGKTHLRRGNAAERLNAQA